MTAIEFHSPRPSLRAPLALAIAFLLCASASTASAWAPAPTARAAASRVTAHAAPRVAVRGVPSERIVTRRAAPARPAITLVKASVVRAFAR